MKEIKLITLLLLTIVSANAQNWSSLGLGTNDGVSALKEDTINDVLYAGGLFTNAGVLTVEHIAKWDGINWTTLNGGVNGSVNSLEIINGELYVGGMFMEVAGASHYFIAKYDGTNWISLGTGIGGSVNAITVYNGEIYAGGFDGLKKYNVSNSNWVNVGLGIGGMNPYVSDLKVFNNELYVAGSFSEAGGMVANGIAKWDGANWHTLGDGLNNFGFGYAVEVYNNELIVGGEFTKAGNVTVNGVAKWDGTQWKKLGSSGTSGGVDGRTFVHDLMVSKGELYLGGNFSEIGGQQANFVARWDGYGFSSLGAGLNKSVWCLESFRGHLITGGEFSTAGGLSSSNIAKWDTPLNINSPAITEQVTIYPNPTNGRFTIDLTEAYASLHVRIVDYLGREVFAKNYGQYAGTLELELPQQNGVYFVELQSEKGNSVFKMIKN